MKINRDDIIELNNKKYIAVQTLNLDNLIYVYLLSQEKPVEIIIGKVIDGKVITCKDIKEVQKIIYLLSNPNNK